MVLGKSASKAGLFLCLFLSCSIGSVIFSPRSGAAGETAFPENRGKVAIIIDDIGESTEHMEEFQSLPAGMTWAIMPLTPYGRQYALEAQRLGVEVLLHQPLEPLNNNLEPGLGLIKRGATQEEICRQFETNLASVPGAVGVNNHMGSAGTADEPLMNVLLWAVKRANLFFIDSMTGSNTVAWQYAKLHRVPFGRRDVFIDNDADFQSKEAALERLLELAVKHGSAIAIGHPRRGTGLAIQAMLPRFAAAGIKLVHVSELVK